MEPTHEAEPTEAAERAADEQAEAAADIEEELLVEEISIDGMCGVY